MRVRMQDGLPGSGFDELGPGVEVEFDDADAIRLIEAGLAVPVEKPIERAVKAAPETRNIKRR